ncbi:hypothetical protein HPB52_011415 [Rhipicephalus sanguineus]|uniref:Nlr family card domain protein n=1 Tax=Rhipicephalus sanguineus TaxID=34632 RepID=A0A9D4PJA5_RHISA|nr:hypothetical protein HPB52_011415 [Rhipicephalus sanguineus]
MDNLPRERDQLSLSNFAERGDTSATVDRAEADRYRPPCTAHTDQVCQINNCLPHCNELLFDSGLKLRQQRGGSFTLESNHRDLTPRRGPDSYRATPFLRWLLKTHTCITALELSDDSFKSHSKVVLQELPDDSRIKNLTLHLFDDDNTHTYLTMHLPRLRSLEVLSCSAGCAGTDAVAGVSALLRTTKSLTCLVFHGSFGFRQPPNALIDALATNSTLKWLDLTTYWETDKPPGPLGEYVKSNGLLTRLTVSGLDVDREELLLEEALVCNHTLSTLHVLNVCGGESVSDLDIFTNGLFRYNDLLTHTIGHSRYISRVSFLENTGFGDATNFVSLLSENIGDNHVLLEVDLSGAKVGGEAKRCLFIIRETTQRNCDILERAAANIERAPLDWHTATAFEKVARSPALIRELSEKEGIATAEVARMLRSRLRCVEGLHDFMRLTGVVKDSVKCAPSVEGRGMQLPDLSDDCWRLVRRYLSFDDVKRIHKPCVSWSLAEATIRRNTMENHPAKRARLSTAVCAERGDTTGILDRGVDQYRPQCTVCKDQVCQINTYISNCNELLFDIGLELREQRGGSLSLVSIPITALNLSSTSGTNSYRATPFLLWLLRTHVCITNLELTDDYVKSHSEVVLSELPDNFPLKKLTLHFFGRDTVHTHIATVLPTLRSLEVLNCFIRCPSSDALVDAVSALLSTTTCLTSLAFYTSVYKIQLPKSFIDALAANSTLKTLHLGTQWMADEPPGPLGEYVRSNRLLTSLSATGHDVDREELLEETLVRNGTLSTLRVANVCGGETSARFITSILAQCSALRKLYVTFPRTHFAEISEATMTRCAEALVKNESLEVLTLAYSLWHPNNWKAFFALLPRNRHLKKLQVRCMDLCIYETFPAVLEILAQTDSLTRVSFGDYRHGVGINLMHFRVFSSIELSGDEIVQVDALQRLPSLHHFTCLSLDLYQASERLFSALAKCIRKTNALRELRLTLTDPFNTANNRATSSCWRLLFESMSANTSIAYLNVFINGSFQYNDRLTRTIGLSRCITRVSFRVNPRDENATNLVSLLSKAIGDNYNLLSFDMFNAKVDVEAKRSLFTIRETTRRNSGLVERAAALSDTTRLDWYTANAFEKVSRCPALVRELAEQEGIDAAEVSSKIRSRLRSVDGLHDFMRLTNVVKTRVTCAAAVDGCRVQLKDINDDCWRIVRRYLSFDDVKRFGVANQDLSTSS